MLPLNTLRYWPPRATEIYTFDSLSLICMLISDNVRILGSDAMPFDQLPHALT